MYVNGPMKVSRISRETKGICWVDPDEHGGGVNLRDGCFVSAQIDPLFYEDVKENPNKKIFIYSGLRPSRYNVFEYEKFLSENEGITWDREENVAMDKSSVKVDGYILWDVSDPPEHIYVYI